MKMMLAAVAMLPLMAGGCMSVSVTETMAATPAAMAMPEITIYHLEGRRSERIVWLMEELGLPAHAPPGPRQPPQAQ